MDAINWQFLTIGALCILVLHFWTQWCIQRDVAWKWRKRWIEQRFGVPVMRAEGNYFCLMHNTNGGMCVMFSKSRRDLSGGGVVRKWDHHLGKQYFSEDADLPDEKTFYLGFPTLE
jgi:hypothetical protein